MEPEIQPPLFAAPHDQSDAPISPETIAHAPSAQGLRFCFFGHEGLRSGWSLLLFFLLCGFAAIPGLFSAITGTVFFLLHLIGQGEGFTAPTVFFMELSGLLALLGAAALIALIERRRSLLDYNLRGPRPAVHFFSGFAAGFVALSALVGALLWGHWMHFGPLALSGATILSYGALWGAAFLLVGCYEEGIYRCFLQFTFTRGLNFWWALSIVAALCLYCLLRVQGSCVWGVYAAALLGVLPCLWLQVKKVPTARFWQAAWVTSTLFGFSHTFNGGENWIGIFAAALVVFVFCVSVYVTGSAWWAIGCHAAWDWAETYFYGTADSGFVAPGHLLSATPAGNAFWSGGTDGPEGSILVIAVLLLLLAALLAIYGRKKRAVLLTDAAG